MKTSLLFMPHHGSGHPHRAYLPAEAPVESSTVRGHEMARFWPAHVETGERVIDLMAGKTKPFSRKMPDMVVFRSYTYSFDHGKTDKVRVMTPEYVRSLDILDREIDALEQKRNAMIEEAWRRARPLKVSDVKENNRE